MPTTSECVGGGAEGVDGHVAPLERKTPEPPHRRPLVPVGIPVAKDEADPQRVLETHPR